MPQPINNSSYSFYVYGNSIARYHKDTKVLEVKNHITDQWKSVENPDVWNRIQIDGSQVSKGDAEKIYMAFHTKLKNENQIGE